MSNPKVHRDGQDDGRFFSKGEFRWEKSKETAWDEISAGLKDESHSGRKVWMGKIQIVAAAVFMVLLTLGAVAWFYSDSYTNPAGTHFTYKLPDGSTIEMNAESSLKYYPYRWPVKRSIVFEGEGFFDVEKGKSFVVKSRLGTTSVMGTTFNIFSRDNLYEVSCISGKVRVEAGNKESVILNPNQQVIVKQGSEMQKQNIQEKEEVLSWRKNIFRFKATPFENVICELERQYGVKIKTSGNVGGSVSANFKRQEKVEDALALICNPFGFTFIKQNNNSYLIVQKE